MRVLITAEAQAQVDVIDAWWRENRTAAPDLFFQELASVLNLLAQAPGLGRSYDHPALNSVRRVLMRSTRYHIYYVVHGDTVLVLAVWSGQRGTGPNLAARG